MSRKQIILIAVFALAGVGVWTPSMLKETPELPFEEDDDFAADAWPVESEDEVEPSDDESFEGATEERAAPEGAATAGDWMEQDPTSEGMDSEVIERERTTTAVADRLAKLELTMNQLESFVPGDGSSNLDRLAETWAGGRPPEHLQSESASSAGLGNAIVLEPGTSLAERQLADARRAAELEAWLVEHPLRGIVRGEEESVALIGGYVVRPGDRLFGGRLEVAAIDSNRLWVEDGSLRFALELPPLRMRVNVGEGDSLSDEEGDSGEAPQDSEVSAPVNPGASAGVSMVELQQTIDALGAELEVPGGSAEGDQP